MNDSVRTGEWQLPVSQVRQIDDLCNRFEIAWKSGQRPSIEDFLGDWHGPERAALVRELVGLDVHYRRAAGETPQAADYSSSFPALDAAGLAEILGAPVSAATAHRGRFTIERLHAEGGLGRVSLAREAKLRRQVALKEIRPDRRSTDARHRFLNEAEITGRLEHPGIVPIYALEEDADGEPYYVMRFIRGRTLADAITAHHQEPTVLGFRDLLQRFVSVCQTLAYAHSQGVIHRDLKPANIMLGDYGETLVVDWGLAKEIGARGEGLGVSEESFSRETPASAAATTVPSGQMQTQQGEAAGTPAYMAPEQARGEWDQVGPAADVFSLGAILYELLTRRRPFVGANVGEVLAKAKVADFPPPRQVKPDVPRALEAICLKAMALKPEDRYATAAALADDVTRWVADEPVSAYAEPWSKRAGRWLRRHRALVTGAAALLVTAVVGLAVGLVVVDGERRKTELERQATARERDEKSKALTAETAARAAENQARELADDHFTHAQDAVELYLNRVTDEPMLKEKDFSDLRKKLLTAAVPFYEWLKDQQQDNDKSRVAVGRAYHRLAVVRAETGEAAAAIDDYRHMQTIFADLAVAFPTRAELRQELARGQNNLGVLLLEAGRAPEAASAHGAALAVQKQLAADFPARPDFRDDLAGTHNNLGNLFRVTGRLPEAESAYGAALVIQRQLAAEFPTRPDFRKDLAGSHNNLGNLFRVTGRLPDAEAAFRAALAIRKQLAAELPTHPESRQELAVSHNNLGNFFYFTNRMQEAESAYGAALALRKGLVAEFPTRPRFRQEVATSHSNLGNMLRATGRLAEAESAFGAALGLQKQLAADFPKQPDLANDLAATLVNLANLSNQRRDFQAAKAYLAEAEPHHQLALMASPRHPTFRLFYRNNLRALVGANAGLLDQPAAVRAAERIRDLGSDPPVNAYDAACALARCIPIVENADALDTAERHAAERFYSDQAMAMLRHAVAKGYKDIAHLKNDDDLKSLRDREDFKKLLMELAP